MNESPEVPTLELVATFGNNQKVPIVNLTRAIDKPQIVYANGHVVSIFNLSKYDFKCLIGHSAGIIYLACDTTGRFLVSADPSRVNIWDHENESMPIRSIISPESDVEFIAVGFSANAKYLATINSTNLLQFWLWTLGNEFPEDEYQIPKTYKDIKSIVFNSARCEFFVVTASNGLIFGTWNIEMDELEIHQPKRINLIRQFNNSIYVTNGRSGVTVTETGHALIWSDILSTNPSGDPITNKKEFRNCMFLRFSPIRNISYIDRKIVISDSSGEIVFYEENLKILYWFKTPKINVDINCFSFDLIPRNYILVSNATALKHTAMKHKNEREIIIKENVPVDSTPEKRPFIIRNFLVNTINGKIYKVDIARKTINQVLFTSDGIITALDMHPNKPWICGGNTSGRIFIYDYEQRNLVSEYQLNSIMLRSIVGGMTCLKFCKNGTNLVIGTTNGYLLSIDPVILKPNEHSKFSRQHSNYSIKKIVFSNNSKLLAYYDTNNNLILEKFEKSWLLIGKLRCHSKTITTILFIEPDNGGPNVSHNNGKYPILISFSEDKHYIEYDIESSIEQCALIIKRYIRIEQSAITKSAILIPSNDLMLNNSHDKNTERYQLLTADDHVKLKIWDIKTMNLLHTYAGPSCSDKSCISDLIFCSSNNNKIIIYSIKNKIGIQTMPIDGNPFKHSATTVYSRKVMLMAKSYDSNYVVSVGTMAYGIYVWKLNPDSLLNNPLSQETGLLPFLHELSNGNTDHLLRKMKELFYYFQIIRNKTDRSADNKITNFISINDVTDFMRGLGYFPSDFEIKNYLTELKTYFSDNENTLVSFLNLIKIYFNHKPQFGYNINDLIKSILYFSMDNVDESDGKISQDDIKIDKKKLYEILTNAGEKLDKVEATKLLIDLLQYSDEETIQNYGVLHIDHFLSKVSKTFTITEFLTQILEIDIDEGFQHLNESKIPPNKIIKFQYEDNKLIEDQSANKDHINEMLDELRK